MSASTKRKLRQAEREAGTDKKALAAAEEAAKKAKEKRKWIIGGIATVLVIALIFFVNSGFLKNNSTAVTIGDEKYSPAVVSYHMASQYYTWANQYASYAELLGLDTSTGIASLATQSCPLMNDGTWKDYFVAAGEQELMQIQVLCDYAEKNGITLSDDEMAEIDANLEETKTYAELMGFGSVESFYKQNYGSQVTPEIARQEGIRGTLANKVLTEYVAALDYSDAELEEYYKNLNGEADYYSYSYYSTETKEDAEAVLAAYNKAEGNDIEAKLDEAVKSVDPEVAAVHSDNVQASGLSSNYKSWLMEQSKAGTAAIVDGSNNDYYVVVFRQCNDNHYKMANIRHILVKAEASEDGTYSDEAKAAAKKEAEDILAQWKAGEKTEESFAALANELSEDGGSNTNGGLYENVIKGQMVEEFDEFCFAGHKAGDTAIVYGESAAYAGYHVMYYVGEGDLYSNAISRDALATAEIESFIGGMTEGLESVQGFGYRFVG